MSDVLDLGAAGLRVFAGRLYHHDYLWFSSFEIAKITRTAPIVHNYALSYALSSYGYGVYRGSRPSYDFDLKKMAAYATPARPAAEHRISWTRLTQNALNTRTQRTEGPRGFNSPALGWRVLLDPCFQRSGFEGGYEFYAFLKESAALPGVIRLGKKGCPVRLIWRQISSSVAKRVSGTIQPTHAVNPLDVQGKVVTYQPVSIPPHLIFRSAEIADDWFLFDSDDRIHVPRRFTPAGALAISADTPQQTRRRRRNA